MAAQSYTVKVTNIMMIEYLNLPKKSNEEKKTYVKRNEEKKTYVNLFGRLRSAAAL